MDTRGNRQNAASEVEVFDWRAMGFIPILKQIQQYWVKKSLTQCVSKIITTMTTGLH